MNVFAYYFLISLLSNQHATAASIIILVTLSTASILTIFPITMDIFSAHCASHKKEEDNYSLKDLELINKFNLELFKMKNKWYGGPNAILYIENSHFDTTLAPSNISSASTACLRSRKLMKMKSFISGEESSVTKEEQPLKSTSEETTSDSTSELTSASSL